MTDPALRERMTLVKTRLEEGLKQIDPHHRLLAHPPAYQVISGRTFEVLFRDVPRIDETEIQGVKRLIGEHSHCSVLPQSAATLTVRFVIPLEGER